MGFDALIRSGVTLADALTRQGLQATVSHQVYASQNAYGEPAWGTATMRRAVVSTTTERIRDERGEEVLARYRILFLGDVTVGAKDKITLPSGQVTPILRVDKGVLADNGGAFVTEVFCG